MAGSKIPLTTFQNQPYARFMAQSSASLCHNTHQNTRFISSHAQYHL